jgi:hypothetical protein
MMMLITIEINNSLIGELGKYVQVKVKEQAAIEGLRTYYLATWQH